jgi:hypothetical protein
MVNRIALVVVVLLGIAATAQKNPPRTEFMFGYTFLRQSSAAGRQNLNGVTLSGTGNFNRWFGFGGQLSGTYGSPFSGASTTDWMFLFGPVFSHRSDAVLTPFGQLLFGVSHRHDKVPTFAISSTGFTWGAGGGFDVKLTPAVALRLFEADYLRSNLYSATQNNLRLVFGIVFRS